MARRAADELRAAGEAAQRAAYDQTAIMQELRNTLTRYVE
jgi:hypothetical protein